MLEVVNLTKVYESKKGATVRALDGVSLRFPETGMVFLLGKSGSGKSTLLNICGGLDSATDGEIIVKGRSSKNFSQSDFDSYRNTFIGFIFQEYNILNEFSVEANIALALELQGKPNDKAAIAKLLEEVDLTGYAKRKPNTLSGGQKQRIAIARALIKSPEIIMADEPTGALDSSTGKQVFDTLKKLSRDKLVLVVSHDREFAEQYGDRIIELKDGRILSDISKTQETQTVVSENVTAIGDTLCVKNGSKLNDRDFDEIKAFLKKAPSDVLIAAGERDVKSFKQVNRITDDGEKEVFRDTDEAKLPTKNYTEADSKFIRSRLPMRHAVKIGASGLKNKPVRLTFTVLLCTVAFILFGLLSTIMFYDSDSTLAQTLKDSDYTMLRINKTYQIQSKGYENGELQYEDVFTRNGSFSAEELAAYVEQYGSDVFGAIEAGTSFSTQSASAYWSNEIVFFAYLPESNTLRSSITVGSYPVNDDEICISSYTANAIVNRGMYDAASGASLTLTSPADVIGKSISLNGDIYKIVGIIDCPELDPRYDELKESDSTDNYSLENDLRNALQDGLHLMAFLTEPELDKQLERLPSSGRHVSIFEYHNICIADRYNQEDGSYEFDSDQPSWNGQYAALSDSNSSVIYVESGKSALLENEAVASSYLFFYRILEYANHRSQSAQDDTEREPWNELRYDVDILLYQADSTPEERAAAKDRILTCIREQNVELTVTLQLYNNAASSVFGEVRTFRIVGFYEDSQYPHQYSLLLPDSSATSLWDMQKVLLNYYQEETTAYVHPQNAVCSTIFLPYDHSDEMTDRFVDIYSNKDFDGNDTRITLASSLVMGFEMADSFVESASQVFLYIGLVLAVFAALLLSNFISVSISQKKKEIGILRAVGARGLDVFKIFFSESFFIALLCILLSVVGTILTCGLMNREIGASIGASLFTFGAPSLLILMGIALATTLVATILPVWNAARKKPVESIRAL